jgi:hypothetical protein
MASRDEILKAAYDGSWNEDHSYASPDGSYASNKNNCVGFVKSVAKAVGVFIPDRRAEFVTAFLQHSNAWIEIKDPDYGYNGIYAEVRAEYNYLVLAARTSHVAVVVPGDLKVGCYPMVWCGSTGSYQSRGDKSVLDIWGSGASDKVQYFYCPRAIFTG